MLALNAYPEKIIQVACQRAHRILTPGGPCCRRDSQDGVLALPYISETVTYQVRKALKRSGLNVRIAQRTGPTLKSILTRSALEPPQCPGRSNCLACMAGLQGKCGTKNVVYRLECVICSKVYIGETKRPVRDRLMEHRRGAKNRDTDNPWGAHYNSIHRNDAVPEVPFQATIIADLRTMWTES